MVPRRRSVAAGVAAVAGGAAAAVAALAGAAVAVSAGLRSPCKPYS